MTENPVWGEDWDAARSNWILDPAVTFLNHGSFGACPKPVLDAQSALRTQMERQPVDFLGRRLEGLLAGARERVAAFLNADPSGPVFVPNATTAVSTVLASIAWSPETRSSRPTTRIRPCGRRSNARASSPEPSSSWCRSLCRSRQAVR